MRKAWQVKDKYHENFQSEYNATTGEIQFHKILPLETGLNEMKILRQLNGLEGVPNLRDYHIEHETIHLYMSYVEGMCLDEILVTDADYIDLFVSAIKLLDCIHQRGVFHRDLCPRHIRVSRSGRLAILDFGCATLEGDFEEIVGTMAYAAPEAIFLPQTYDESSDRFALSKSFYEVFKKSFSKSCPDTLAVFEKAMALDPQNRYKTAEAIIGALKR